MSCKLVCEDEYEELFDIFKQKKTQKLKCYRNEIDSIQPKYTGSAN